MLLILLLIQAILLFGIPIYGIFVMRSMYKRWKQHTGKFSSKISSRAKIIICIAAYGLVAFASIYLAVGDFSSPSKVDPKPFSQLEHATFYDIEDAIKYLEGSMEELGAYSFGMGVVNEKNPYGPVARFGYNCPTYSNYRPNIVSTSVNIELSFFSSYENAKEWFNSMQYFHGGKEVQLSDNIEALLCRSSIIRNADLVGIYNSDRDIETFVRINNLMINFSERTDRAETVGRATNEAIEKLCAVLAQWEGK